MILEIRNRNKGHEISECKYVKGIHKSYPYAIVTDCF